MLKISKLFISVLVCCFAVCLLSGCESEETKLKNISDLVTRFSSGEEISDSDIQIYKSYHEDAMFEKTVCQELDTFNKDSDYEKVVNLLTVLDDERIDYQSEKVNEKAAETIEKLKKEYLSISDIKDIDIYLTKVEPFVSLYSFTKDVKDIYGTTEIIDFVQQNGTKIIAKDNAGGYFDSRKGSYKERETDYFDPLSNKYVSYGEVGTYKTRTSYDFYGDILKVHIAEIWYTPYSEPNGANTSYSEYRYKDEGEDILHGFGDDLIDGDVEGYDLSKDDSVCLVIYDKEELNIITEKEMKTLKR